MRRTQLYLDDDLWSALHAEARLQDTTISELVRAAIRERYLGDHAERLKAMQAFIGIRKDEPEQPDAVTMVRALRRGKRLERLYKQ